MCAYYVDLIVGAYYIVMLVLVGAYYIVTLVGAYYIVMLVLVCAYYIVTLVDAYYVVMLVLVCAYYIVTLVDTHTSLATQSSFFMANASLSLSSPSLIAALLRLQSPPAT